jgi:DNA-binding transcriptional MerR regulator
MTTLLDAGCSIEEASARTGVSAHTLRYYERIGLLAPVGRAPGGHRRYTDGDLGAVVFLTLLRETGMSIRDMQRFVELTRAGDHTIPSRVEVLVKHREQLVERLRLLNKHLKAIDHKINIYQGMLRAEEAPGAPSKENVSGPSSWAPPAST